MQNNQFITINEKKYPFSYEVDRYSEYLTTKGIEILEENEFIYIPLIDSLYSLKWNVIFYSLNPFFSYLTESMFGYFERIQQNYSQHMNLLEYGLLGLTTPVPITSVAKGGTDEIIECIETMYKDILKSVDFNVSHFPFLLNEEMDFDWKIQANYLDKPFNITGCYKKDINEFFKGTKDFKVSLYKEDTLKVRYTHLDKDEISNQSISKLSRMDVSPIEVIGNYNFIKEALLNDDEINPKLIDTHLGYRIKEKDAKKNPTLWRNPYPFGKDVISIVNDDTYLLDISKMNYYEYQEQMRHTGETFVQHNWKYSIMLIKKLILENNCKVIIGNKFKFSTKEGRRYIKIKKTNKC